MVGAFAAAPRQTMVSPPVQQVLQRVRPKDLGLTRPLPTHNEQGHTPWQTRQRHKFSHSSHMLHAPPQLCFAMSIRLADY